MAQDENITLESPFEGISQVSENIELQNIKIIEKTVQSFFKNNKAIVKAVYKDKASPNNLHFYIVFENDSMKNRSKIFSFLDNYDLTNFSEKYPIHFQFVPKELTAKIIFLEELNIN